MLSRADVRHLLDLDACIEAVEDAFRAEAEGRNGPRGLLGCRFGGGTFHVKASGLAAPGSADGGEPLSPLFAAKVNANFPDNPGLRGLPAIQGIVALFDASDGFPLALLDSIEITAARTAAATAVAARHLARPGSSTAAICGCGTQGRAQLAALVRVLPIESVKVFDRDAEAARRYAREMEAELGISVAAAASAREAVRGSDVCVTCTPSREPFLGLADLTPGTFVAAVGADDAGKQELESELVARSLLVADVLDQCAEIGELRHAVAAGWMTKSDAHAELAEVVAGTKPGRESDAQTIVFDSTGTALEDAAAAALVYRRAVAEDVGMILGAELPRLGKR